MTIKNDQLLNRDMINAIREILGQGPLYGEDGETSLTTNKTRGASGKFCKPRSTAIRECEDVAPKL